MKGLTTRRLGGLWRNPDFLKLWTGQTVSLFGTLMAALQFTAILVLHATPLQMGLLMAAGTVPGILGGLVIGVWVDRLRRRPVLIGADIGRAALLGSIPIAFLLGLLRIEHLYLVAFGHGVLTILFDVAYHSYLPSLVERRDLLEANSKLSASGSAVEVVSFGLGGWLVQVFSAITAVVVDALSFLVSALLLGWIQKPEPGPVIPAPAARSRSTRRDIRDGLRLVWREPVLRAIAGSMLSTGLATGIIGSLIVLYGVRELGIQPGVLGMVFAVGGISSIAGALVAGRVTHRLGIGPAMMWGLLLYGCTAFFIPLAPGWSVLAAVAFLAAAQLFGDAAIAIYDITQASLRQSMTPGESLGRVSAAMRIIELGAMLAGSLLAGALAQTLGLRPALAIGAASMVLGALWLALSPVGRMKEPPSSVEAPGKQPRRGRSSES